MNAYFSEARKKYHANLLNSILTVGSDGIPSNADKDSRLSVEIAKGITNLLETNIGLKAAGQTSGSKFEIINMEFLKDTFLKLSNIRPGNWDIQRIGNNDRLAISRFEQYSHLYDLHEISKRNPELAAILGSDYTITPDVIISHSPFDDDVINTPTVLVDDTVCLKTVLRKSNGGKDILHASISSKWTIRSDRSQNSRTEALNLIRNRKGHLPHIVVVTGEPLPSRIASISLGTGDIDCVYHFALYELIQAVNEFGNDDSVVLMQTMINGKRLKDISDLPLDLAV